jgi:SAM-dependent methyltransferase
MLGAMRSSSSPRPDWWSALACPRCRSPLADEGTALRCRGCATAFDCAHGVPFLVDGRSRDRGQLETADGQVMVRGYRRPSRLVAALRAIVSSDFSPGRQWRETRAATLAAPGPVLVLGSGRSQEPGAIHLDLDDFPGVAVVGDAHHLPFGDGTLGAVVADVVGEHLFDAARAIAEVHRVLRPGGVFWFSVPFLFPWHGHPADYRRWSRQGLAAEFSAFADVTTGVRSGPCSALVNVLTEFAWVATGCRFPRGYTLVKGLATALLFPLKFGDLLVRHSPEAHRLAATLFVCGRKPVAVHA